MRSNELAVIVATAPFKAVATHDAAMFLSARRDEPGSGAPAAPPESNNIFFRLFVAWITVSCLLAVQPAESADTVQTAGDVMTLLLPAAAGTAALALSDREGGEQLVKSMALALGTTLILKYSINEKRPNGESYSFPSGHSAVSFSAAESIRNRYGWEYGIPAYAAASFVAYSRVDAREHYFRDVLAGAIIGAGSSYLFTTPYKDLKIGSEAVPGYLGVKVSSTW